MLHPSASNYIYIAVVLPSTVMPTGQLHHPLTNLLTQHTSLLSSQHSAYQPFPSAYPLQSSDLYYSDNRRSSHTYFLAEPIMSYATNWKEGDGDFLLVVAGLTRFAPYLSGWQEFKDHIRKVVREQPGWVEVYASQSQRRGEMQGWCRLKDKEDADAAYSECCSVSPNRVGL